jgi:phage tail-like protein
LPIPAAPAGIARADDGALFYTEPDKHRLWRIDVCDPQKTAQPAACIGGEGSDATQFKLPRGLLFLPGRGLLIADSGNNRIQIIDPLTLRALEIWNGADNYGNPLLHEPWALAADSEGNIYVVVHGDRSVQKIDRWGRVDPEFRKNIETSYVASPLACALAEPVAIAIAMIDGEELVLVLDRSLSAIVVFNQDGNWQKTFTVAGLQAPLALAVSERAIFIGDPGDQSKTVLQYDLPALKDDHLNLVGAAVGYRGPTAALIVDCHGTKALGSCHPKEVADRPNGNKTCHILLHPGYGLAPLVLEVGAGYLTSGFAVAGPFDHRRLPVVWHRLQAFAETPSPRAHIRFFFLPAGFDESLTGEPPPAPPVAVANNPGEPFQGWCAFPPDAVDCYFESFVTGDCSRSATTQFDRSAATSTYLWLGMKLSADGESTPRVRQIRLQFDHETYLPFLPALYSEEQNSRQFLLPFLSLFESFFAEPESTIARLTELFDPAAAPAEFLEWLAGWLAQDIREEWSDRRKRQMIAKAFADYAKRGTASGLRRRLLDFTGVQASILEPSLNADLWSLDENSTLNFDTMLARGEAQGAVLGTTATLDHSHLITDSEFGAPLFEEVAHRFTVVVYPNAVSTDKKLDEILAVIERDKPAHTIYHLCVIRSPMRVGFQSTVGVDTVVSGPEPATPLEETSPGGLILAGTPLARLGEDSRIGVNTQLY